MGVLVAVVVVALLVGVGVRLIVGLVVADVDSHNVASARTAVTNAAAAPPTAAFKCCPLLNSTTMLRRIFRSADVSIPKAHTLVPLPFHFLLSSVSHGSFPVRDATYSGWLPLAMMATKRGYVSPSSGRLRRFSNLFLASFSAAFRLASLQLPGGTSIYAINT
jgi:hypothetical protein